MSMAISTAEIIPLPRGASQGAIKPELQSNTSTVTAVAFTVADLVKEHFRAINSTLTNSDQTALDHALKAGALLLQQRKKLRHGEFGPWLKKHCAEIPDRKARAWMHGAEMIQNGDPSPKSMRELYSTGRKNTSTSKLDAVEIAVRTLRKAITEAADPLETLFDILKRSGCFQGDESFIQRMSPGETTFLSLVKPSLKVAEREPAKAEAEAIQAATATKLAKDEQP